MNRMNKGIAWFTGLAIGAAGTLMLSANRTAAAATDPYEASLRRGSVEDTTPQQKYQTAIREAGGAFKEAQRECAAQPARDPCLREARAVYERDMAEARGILRGLPPRERAPREAPPDNN